MISVSPKHTIFIAINPIDFRKGIEALARCCQQQFLKDPFLGHYFLFRNKRGTSMKLLYYDSQGFCLWQKRFSSGRFKHWPCAHTSVLTLTPAQLHVLLYNGDPSNIDESKPFKSLSHIT